VAADGLDGRFGGSTRAARPKPRRGIRRSVEFDLADVQRRAHHGAFHLDGAAHREHRRRDALEAGRVGVADGQTRHGPRGVHTVSALTGATGVQILADELLRIFVSAAMREAQAVGAAVGVPIEQTPEQRHAVTRKLGAFRSSMLQDPEAGRALDVDALIGAVHEIGGHLGHPLPHTSALLGLVRLLARTRGPMPPATDRA
jgi:hypothetical protein